MGLKHPDLPAIFYAEEFNIKEQRQYESANISED